MDSKHKWSLRIVVLTAICSIVWAIAALGFQIINPTMARWNAVGLLAYWTLIIPAWFFIEWWIWGKDPIVRGRRRFARDIWIGATALVVLLASGCLKLFSSNGPWFSVLINLQTEAIKFAIWPIVTIFSLILFKNGINAFLSGIGSRVSKLTAFGTTLELATLPTAKALSGPMLDELKGSVAAIAGDSSRSLLRTLVEAGNADYVLVNLGEGEEWITSRLFILAALIPRVRLIKQIVYLTGPDRQLLGVSTPEALYKAILSKYEWFEPAYISSHVAIVKVESGPLFVYDDGKSHYLALSMQPNKSVIGRIGQDEAQQVLDSFLNQIKAYSDPQNQEWVRIQTPYSQYWEHAEWVTDSLLVRLLGADLDTKAVMRDLSEDGSAAARTLLRHDEDYVPVVDSANRLNRLVDRRSAVNELIRRWLSSSA